MQLHPRETFTVVRQLQNPFITDTLYVRAVIRNAKTDAIITSLDLTDRTEQRFSKNWIIPADPSGQGFWISIVTSVYSDSGYTSKSENYGDEENTYLVQDRYVFNPNYPVGADIDYKRIKKIVDAAADRVIAAAADAEPKIVTVTKQVVHEVKVPEIRVVETQQKPDFTEVLREIRVVGQKVDDKEVTEVPPSEPVDLSPVIEAIHGVGKDVASKSGDISKKLDSLKVEVAISNPVVEAKVKPVMPMVDKRISSLMKK